MNSTDINESLGSNNSLDQLLDKISSVYEVLHTELTKLQSITQCQITNQVSCISIISSCYNIVEASEIFISAACTERPNGHLAALKERSQQPHPTHPLTFVQLAQELRKLIENTRVDQHYYCSAKSINTHSGLTEDVGAFLAVICLDGLVSQILGFEYSNPILNSGPADLTQYIGVLNHSLEGKLAIKHYTLLDLQLAYDVIYVNRRSLPWKTAEFRSYLSVLQWQLEMHLFKSIYGNVSTRDRAPIPNNSILQQLAKWSCTTARTKLMCLYATTLASRTGNPNAVSKTSLTTRSHVDKLNQWYRSEIPNWEGPRMRAAVSMAIKKRDLTHFEAGEICAFESNAQLKRAKGSMNCVEELVQRIDFAALIAMPFHTLKGPVLMIRELVLIKLLANALELHSCDFLKLHIALDSSREMWTCMNFHNRASPVHKIIESPEGWHNCCLEGHCSSATDLDSAVIEWYVQHFGNADPLAIF